MGIRIEVCEAVNNVSHRRPGDQWCGCRKPANFIANMSFYQLDSMVEASLPLDQD